MKIGINLKRNADAKKDKYLQGFLDRIKQTKTDKEKLAILELVILDKIYSNGFEDGTTEKKEFCEKCGKEFYLNQLKKHEDGLFYCKNCYPVSEKKAELHIIVGVYSGVVNDVEVFKNEKDADRYEKELCEKYEIPYDAKDRTEYYDSNGEHEIKHFITELH